MGGNSASTLVNAKRLEGKTAIVTGCNVGIGKETVKELYKSGARVIMACRDTEKANAAAESIQKDLENSKDVGTLVVKPLNLSSLKSVRECAADINQSEPRVHILINNAGVMMVPKGETEDGFETHLGVNHFGHFLFTCLLLPKLIASAPSRIINVSSKAHEWGKIDFNDLNCKNSQYNPRLAYSHSKIANILFTVELARRLKDKGVTAYSLHPGIVRTELGRYIDETYFTGAQKIARVLFYPISKSPAQGALTTLYCTYKDVENDSGAYFSDCMLKKRFDTEDDLKQAKLLWEESCKLVDHQPEI
ncbi:short chain dehydrogenase [Nesidiocoris tenuis]|uniref:Short chain dehydrogenase n=1 Tax=Nesidiocoris tenuis TaxID=355587 RepID=A0ABN7B5D4_9HEMI|nr:short chain dehydrogenase [Nesidiocoris tenuis]